MFFCSVQQHPHPRVTPNLFLTSPFSLCYLHRREVGSSTYRMFVQYPYHLSIIEHRIREGKRGRDVRCSRTAAGLPALLVLRKNSIYYHTNPDGHNLSTSSPGAPRVPFSSWLPAAARRVVRGRLSLAR